MSNKIITPAFVGSFVTLVTPTRPPGTDADLKYSITMVLPKEDPFWKKMEALVNQTAKDKFGKVPNGLRSPIKDGDLSEYGMEGCFYMALTAKEDRKPDVVDASLQAVIDPKELYSGALYRASIRPYAWSHQVGGKGVSFGLDNVMKVADGDPLDGRTKATDDFADFAEDESEVAATPTSKASGPAASLLD